MTLFFIFLCEEVGYINSNKFVLAVSTYVKSEWFKLCYELYTQIEDLIIFPLMDLLGINGRSNIELQNKGWQGIRDF